MRLFIALQLPEDAIAALVQAQMLLPAGRLAPEENLHLTLAFLGEHNPDDAERVHEALCGLRGPVVDLRLAGGLVFGGKGGQAIAMGADGGEPLTALHGRIRSRLHGAGLPQERRRFRPHVTLARIAGRAESGPMLAPLQALSFGPFAARSFALVQSTLHAEGAIHEPLARYDLG